MKAIDCNGKGAFDLCLEFIAEQVQSRISSTGEAEIPPLFVAITGVQGCGKTTLCSSLATELNARYPWSSTTTCSIDQFYLTREQQRDHASAHPSNPLIQHRGQPSTHDLPLALTVLSELRNRQMTDIPHYDKSAFDGKGDRVPRDQWQRVNRPGESPTEIVIIEGWCLGFRALPENDLQAKWEAAVLQRTTGSYVGRLGHCRFADISFINKALSLFDPLTDKLDILIHLDAKEPMFCYSWRLEQEMMLRENHQASMTDSQVSQFVDGYYPAYELYLDGLRNARMRCKGSRLGLVLDRRRNVEKAAIE